MFIEKEKIEEGIKMTDKKLSKRIFAYIIDSTIVLLLTTLIINIKYLNPTYDTALEKSNTLEKLNISNIQMQNYLPLYYKDKEKTYMKCYPAAKQEDSYEFPAGVNGGGLCFANCRYLKKVVYAKDSIMGQDFYECHNLTVVLPDVVVNPATGSESDSYDGKWEPFKNCTNFILQGKKNPFMQACAVSKGFTYSIV